MVLTGFAKRTWTTAPRWTCLLVLAAILALAGSPAEAAHYRHAQRPHTPRVHWLQPHYSTIVIDAANGKVLSEANADDLHYPASLTKMMTLYLVFEALHQNRLKLDQHLRVSVHAASQSPTKLGLEPGESIAVQDIILGLVTRSANDAAVVAAEGLAGSEDDFAIRMTQKARALGMSNTTFRNASGLPDPEQVTTARDIATLAKALYRDFPVEYRFFATESFTYKGELVTTHNHLMSRFAGMDGIKTGFIKAAGFNLAASAVRDNWRLIGVVMGGTSAYARDEQMAALLNRNFAHRPVETEMEMADLTNGASDNGTAAGSGAFAAATPAPVDTALSNTPLADTPLTSNPQLADSFSVRAAQTLSHLSPIPSAEAAPVAAPRHIANGGRWSIQVGAYDDRDSAAKAAHAALVRLPGDKNRSAEVVAPNPDDKSSYYRAVVTNFSAHEAQQACHLLHRQHRGCTLISPASLRLASR